MTERSMVVEFKSGERLYSPRVDVDDEGVVTVIEPFQIVSKSE